MARRDHDPLISQMINHLSSHRVPVEFWKLWVKGCLWLDTRIWLQLRHKSGDSCTQNKITINFAHLHLWNHGHHTVYFYICFPQKLKWKVWSGFQGGGPCYQSHGLELNPSPGRGGNLVPNIPVACVLTKCLLLEIESLVGFPSVNWWAWEQIQYQESKHEIIIHWSLLGRKFRAVSLYGAFVEGGCVLEKGSVEVCM